jgi:hypothetical protein
LGFESRQVLRPDVVLEAALDSGLCLVLLGQEFPHAELASLDLEKDYAIKAWKVAEHSSVVTYPWEENFDVDYERSSVQSNYSELR